MLHAKLESGTFYDKAIAPKTETKWQVYKFVNYNKTYV